MRSRCTEGVPMASHPNALRYLGVSWCLRHHAPKATLTPRRLAGKERFFFLRTPSSTSFREGGARSRVLPNKPTDEASPNPRPISAFSGPRRRTLKTGPLPYPYHVSRSSDGGPPHRVGRGPGHLEVPRYGRLIRSPRCRGGELFLSPRLRASMDEDAAASKVRPDEISPWRAAKGKSPYLQPTSIASHPPRSLGEVESLPTGTSPAVRRRGAGDVVVPIAPRGHRLSAWPSGRGRGADIAANYSVEPASRHGLPDPRWYSREVGTASATASEQPTGGSRVALGGSPRAPPAAALPNQPLLTQPGDGALWSGSLWMSLARPHAGRSGDALAGRCGSGLAKGRPDALAAEPAKRLFAAASSSPALPCC
ncbi:hypothetical protein Nepgr_017685 [Nepenthes gracilis]|uniref:Uncharacterized protein n=1 Tax=Nepenthes gracilis TaxID=150966 RepID=A0AAD3SS10_NEPGR|nr:hypothetical protein Nepgr_017685 [Nepenthes gracilis]